eukprot:TRINITY_DN1892_c0_g1_i5.p1 TRINITY_DN1892_c0_g1~~TRINITY_DN1892_c0_g1_i5.p1  ORF type:complete len:408 (+),score=41.68 TRINITY_DN1892_c0_g1_i5:876-2099(+)
MLSDPMVLVPNLDEGAKIVDACNNEFLLDATARHTTLSGVGVTLPAEFSSKLDFDVNQRRQFEGHPLTSHAAGGLEGFGKRLTRVYTSMVALKVELGYEGSLIGLWNQDVVYVLGELLCYVDDVMAVRIMMAFEEVFLSEAVFEENVACLTKEMDKACPTLMARLRRDDCCAPTMFGVYRSCCTTLLCRTFGGRPILPRLWRECIFAHSLKPIIHFLVLVIARSETSIVANYDSGRGITDLVTLLKQTVAGLPESKIEDMFQDVKETLLNEQGRDAERREATSFLGGWMVLSSTVCMVLKYFYPIAYGLIPSWAVEHGSPPHPFFVRIGLTVAWWFIFYSCCSILFTSFSDTATPASHHETSDTAPVFSAIISTVVVLVPIVPIVTIYHGQSREFRPLESESPRSIP